MKKQLSLTYGFSTLLRESRTKKNTELPSSKELQKLKVGNAVQLAFGIKSNDRKAPKSEKLWVVITERGKVGSKGKLQKGPTYIQNLSAGDVVQFDDNHILRVLPTEGAASCVQSYVDGCFTTLSILQGKKPIGYVFRSEPEYAEDSGWAFVPPYDGKAEPDDNDPYICIPLGSLLLIDESIRPLLDSAIGSEYERSPNGKRFRRLDS